MIKILVIDDDQDFLQIFDFFVKKSIKNSSITKLDDPTNIFQSFTQEELLDFDVIVSDYHMKKIDGIQLCNFLKSNSVNTSFILCSSYDLLDILDDHKDKPYDYFIQKRPNVKAFFREMVFYINNLTTKEETIIKTDTDVVTLKSK
ncbi:MAG: response regulator [Candidatus Hodarchaeales archaeon]|jgi:CheY-like chemotaxis protein